MHFWDFALEFFSAEKMCSSSWKWSTFFVHKCFRVEKLKQKKYCKALQLNIDLTRSRSCNIWIFFWFHRFAFIASRSSLVEFKVQNVWIAEAAKLYTHECVMSVMANEVVLRWVVIPTTDAGIHSRVYRYDEMLTAHFIITLKDKTDYDTIARSSCHFIERREKKIIFIMTICARVRQAYHVPSSMYKFFTDNSAFTAFTAIQIQLIYSWIKRTCAIKLQFWLRFVSEHQNITVLGCCRPIRGYFTHHAKSSNRNWAACVRSQTVWCEYATLTAVPHPHTLYY